MEIDLKSIAKNLVTSGGGKVDPSQGKTDSVPATIEGVQPASLSEGEFVIPADVVSAIGKGSPEAGAQILQSMVDQVRSLGVSQDNSKGISNVTNS